MTNLQLREPTFADLRALPLLLERKVPQEYEDFNGHMNISGFMRLHDEASIPFMEKIGMDQGYVAERQLTIFDLEHHLRYYQEVLIGAPIAVHARTFGRTEKLVHGQWYLLDLERGHLSNTFEFVTAHVSLETRRTAPLPAEVAAALDSLIAADARLDWQPPVSGALSLRR